MNVLLRELSFFKFVKDNFEWLEVVESLVLNIAQTEGTHRSHARGSLETFETGHFFALIAVKLNSAIITELADEQLLVYLVS